MTDARFPEKWLQDRRLLRLSDAAFRLHVTALAWSVSNRTDGTLHEDDLPLIPKVDPARAVELEKNDLWKRTKDQWAILDFEMTQTGSDELAALEGYRHTERVKKARYRAKQAEEAEQGKQRPQGRVPRDSPRDGLQGQSTGTVHGTAQARPGKARTGALRATNGKSDLRSNPSTDVAVSSSQAQPEVDGWPEVAPVGAGGSESLGARDVAGVSNRGNVPPDSHAGSHSGSPHSGLGRTADHPAGQGARRVGVCSVCNEPMRIIEPGQTTHPMCGDS